MSTITHKIGTTVHVAPETLLLARNVREATPDKGLVKSVRELGVVEPITAVLNEAGDLLVRFGHRRTLAAVEAGTETVPVYVTAADSTEKDAEVARIVAQRDENTHRAGLTTTDEVAVVEQLTAFGLSAAQIAKQARIKRTDVDTALAVSESTIARKATERYDSLTLDQAATVADFEDDSEAVKALLVAAHEGRFEHVAQRARDDRDEAQARETVLAALADEPVRVVERPGYDDKTVAPLTRLTTGAEDREALSPTGHAECPGHVAWLGAEWVRVGADGQPVEFPDEPDHEADDAAWEAHEAECQRLQANTRRVQRPVPVYGCEGWRKHGHHDSYAMTYGTPDKPKAADMSPEEREAAKAQRQLVVEYNKAWAAAEPVRREFLSVLAKAKTPPKGTARFLATALGTDPRLIGDVGANHLAAQWLGKSAGPYGRAELAPAKSATDNRCLMHTLVIVLAAYEGDLIDRTWRENGIHNAAGRYLRFLSERCGYTLSEVEQYAISANTA